MTFASIAIALPMAALVALAAGWLLNRFSMSHTMASLWSCSCGALIGIAALLSDKPAGLVRGVWPREAVDWLALAAIALTLTAQFQRRPVKLGRATLIVGLLLGMLLVCRLLFGSVYLRPGNTSLASWLAIGLGGSAIGLSWHLELARERERNWIEAALCALVSIGASAALGMSGSFQYGMIGLLVTLTACASWASTRSWPWVSNLVIGMLLGLGLAFSELKLATMVCLSLALLSCSWLGLVPVQSSFRRARAIGMCAIGCTMLACLAGVTYEFMQDVKGNNASNGGYEAYK